MSEGVITGQEKPAVATLLRDLARCSLRESVSVVAPLGCCRRAGLTGELSRSGTGDQEDLAAGSRDLLRRKRHRRTGDIRDRVNALGIKPLTGDRCGNIS